MFFITNRRFNYRLYYYYKHCLKKRIVEYNKYGTYYKIRALIRFQDIRFTLRHLPIHKSRELCIENPLTYFLLDYDRTKYHLKVQEIFFCFNFLYGLYGTFDKKKKIFFFKVKKYCTENNDIFF